MGWVWVRKVCARVCWWCVCAAKRSRFLATLGSASQRGIVLPRSHVRVWQAARALYNTPASNARVALQQAEGCAPARHRGVLRARVPGVCPCLWHNTMLTGWWLREYGARLLRECVWRRQGPRRAVRHSDICRVSQLGPRLLLQERERGACAVCTVAVQRQVGCMSACRCMQCKYVLLVLLARQQHNALPEQPTAPCTTAAAAEQSARAVVANQGQMQVDHLNSYTFRTLACQHTAESPSALGPRHTCHSARKGRARAVDGNKSRCIITPEALQTNLRVRC
jgi:hypothetical protein